VLAFLEFIKIILLIGVEALDIPFSPTVKDLYQFGIEVNYMLLESQVLTSGVVYLELIKLLAGESMILHEEWHITVDVHHHLLLLLLRHVFMVVPVGSGY
jgi:hypothetical protein